MNMQPSSAGADYPAPAPMLEEACAANVGDEAAALAFALARLGGLSARLPMLVCPRRWLAEHGRPFAPAIMPDAGLLLIATRNEEDALWAMEQALRSGAVAGVIGAVEKATLTQTRRLDFAARDGGGVAVLLEPKQCHAPPCPSLETEDACLDGL
ncbi:MAG: hypothetical protein JWM38_1506, partial [Sphingomonas bacterium]|nr:hypothetical protein [Sphingomonas bacterium]